MQTILIYLIAVAIVVAVHLLRSAGRARGSSGRPYNHELTLKHRRINAQHLRNGGAMPLALACLAAGYALAFVLWAIAYGLFSLTEPRW